MPPRMSGRERWSTAMTTEFESFIDQCARNDAKNRGGRREVGVTGDVGFGVKAARSGRGYEGKDKLKGKVRGE